MLALNVKTAHQQIVLNTKGAFQYIYHPNIEYARKRFDTSQYVVCEMQYARSTGMSYYIQLDFAIHKPAFFSGHLDPQSTAQQMMCHIRQSVSRECKQSQEQT